jgi:hypothetical protein
MLGASGAGLECLEFDTCLKYDREVGDRLARVAQVLRFCSSTLKVLRFAKIGRVYIEEDCDDDYWERLQLQWADVLAGVSSCRELQVLRLPSTWIEPLLLPAGYRLRQPHNPRRNRFPTTPLFPPDAGVMGLPALATLKVTLDSRRSIGGGRRR